MANQSFSKRIHAFLLIQALLLMFVPCVQADETPQNSQILHVRDAQRALLITQFSVAVLQDSKLLLTSTESTFHLATGNYELVISATGFVSARLKYHVVAGLSIINVSLSPLLKQIGSTFTQSVQLNANTPLGNFPDLERTLGSIPGVSVSQSAKNNAASEVQLRGKSAGETLLQLDGISIGVAGSRLDIGSIAPDLVSSTDVAFAPSPSGLGGTVNLKTLEPTDTFRQGISALYDSYRSSLKLSATGPAGPLQTAVQVVDTYSFSPLTGRDYLDQSGLSYQHGGESRRVGASVKLLYRLTKRVNLKALALYSNRSDQYLDGTFTTNAPGGIGPSGLDRRRFSFVDLNADSAIGNVLVSASAYRAYQITDYNEQAAVINQEPSPSIVYRPRSFNGFSARASNKVGATNIEFSAQRSSEVSATNVLLPYNYDAVANVGTERFQLSSEMPIAKQFRIQSGISYISSDGAGAGFFQTASAAFASKLLRTKLSFAGGSLPITIAPAGALFPPTTALTAFSCGGYIQVTGPPDAPNRRQARSVDLQADETRSPLNLGIDAYTQRIAGESYNLFVPASGEPSSFFPTNYLDQLSALYHSATICGSQPLDPNHIYVQQLVNDLTIDHRGFEISSHFKVGNAVVLRGAYSVNVSKVISADSRFAGPYSYVLVGRQLPDAPIQSGNIAVSDTATGKRIGFSVSAVFTSENNANHYSPFSTENLSVSRYVGAGVLELSFRNLLNVNAGPFSTTSDAIPYILRDGSKLFPPNISLTPREVSIRYNLLSTRK